MTELERARKAAAYIARKKRQREQATIERSLMVGGLLITAALMCFAII